MNDGQFRRFCAQVGRAELATDPRFATNPARVTIGVAALPLGAQVEIDAVVALSDES